MQIQSHRVRLIEHVNVEFARIEADGRVILNWPEIENRAAEFREGNHGDLWAGVAVLLIAARDQTWQ